MPTETRFYDFDVPSSFECMYHGKLDAFTMVVA
jgi:hypothetical protein